MTFDAFRDYLRSAHRSATTGKPFGQDAAGDYPSRLRRLQALLQTTLENAPPMALRSLAAGLRQDPRVVAAIPARVIGDIAVALRAYANFVDSRVDAETAEPHSSLAPEVILGELQILSFVATSTASKKIVRLKRNDLTVYVRLDSRDPLIIHPAFEECYSTLARLPHSTPTGHIRFFHNSNLTEFPKRDNGRRLAHYGIQFAFSDRSDIRIFVKELYTALSLTSSMAHESTLEEEIKEVETEATALRKARVGQGRYRADLLNFWQGRCAITGVYAPELLRASHIKPWRDSTNLERLDAFNGLLLAVHLDALFDRALITFQDSGDMMISKRLSTIDREVFGLISPARRLLLSVPHIKYMRYHREQFRIRQQENSDQRTYAVI
jgi:hypothetical protein